jgi:hypothetical protein
MDRQQRQAVAGPSPVGRAAIHPEQPRAGRPPGLRCSGCGTHSWAPADGIAGEPRWGWAGLGTSFFSVTQRRPWFPMRMDSPPHAFFLQWDVVLASSCDFRLAFVIGGWPKQNYALDGDLLRDMILRETWDLDTGNAFSFVEIATHVYPLFPERCTKQAQAMSMPSGMEQTTPRYRPLTSSSMLRLQGGPGVQASCG